MNTNARFLNEAKLLEVKWAKNGLLDGIKDRWDRRTTATMMCCERLINERSEKRTTLRNHWLDKINNKNDFDPAI